MCSVSNATGDMNVIENLSEKLEVDREENQSLILKDDTTRTNVICENLNISKSIVQDNRQVMMHTAALYLNQQCAKIADTINVDGCEGVHIGHIINITENILLNTEKNELEIKNRKMRDYNNYFPMIDRMHWLAQPSLSEKEYLKEPAKFVIICHTATEESYTQADNVLMLRLLQTFHIDSQKWSDIAYNFCIGSDGNAYEGRGWFVQGSHTLHYNKYAVGIAFIGCFLGCLPPIQSLKKCKDLIAHGVKIGAISPDYQLLAHSQCRPFESPGKRLFEEIKTWKNFNPNISLKNPGISFD